MRSLILCYFLIPSCSQAADSLYTAPARCTATVLNDRGEIAGEYFDAGTGVDGRGFEVTAGGLMQPLNPQAGRIDYVLPHWINSSGVLAVEYGPYRGPSTAGVYLPATRSLINLNPVFSWAGPSRALTVNDSGAVAAVSSNPSDKRTATSFGVGVIFALLNNQVSITSFNLNESGPVVGGIPWNIDAPSTGPVFLKQQVVAFSPGGHILTRDAGDFGIPGFYIYVPGTTQKELAIFSERPFAINDKDQMLLHPGAEDYVWDQNGPARRLQDLIDPQSPWSILRGIAINNAGQILVEARQGNRTTSLILSPQ